MRHFVMGTTHEYVKPGGQIVRHAQWNVVRQQHPESRLLTTVSSSISEAEAVETARALDAHRPINLDEIPELAEQPDEETDAIVRGRFLGQPDV